MSPKEKSVNEVSQQYIADRLVDSFWNPYQAVITSARQFTEEAVSVWQNVADATQRIQQDGRMQAEAIVAKANVASKGVVNPFLENSALENVVEQIQAIAETPIRRSMDLLEKTEQALQERSSEFVKAYKEQRIKWWNMHDSFSQATRNNQQSFLRRVEDNMRSIVHL